MDLTFQLYWTAWAEVWIDLQSGDHAETRKGRVAGQASALEDDLGHGDESDLDHQQGLAKSRLQSSLRQVGHQ